MPAFWIVAIISDTAPIATQAGSRTLSRHIRLTAKNQSEAIYNANSLFFLLSGERDAPFKHDALKNRRPYVAVSSQCRNYHVEIWRDGETFQTVPGSSEARSRFIKGNSAEWRTESEIIAEALTQKNLS